MNSISEKYSRSFSISKKEDIYEIRRQVANLAEGGSFSSRESEELKIAVTELLTNILKHGESGKGGQIKATYKRASSGDSIKIKVVNPTKLTNLKQLPEFPPGSSKSLGIGLKGVKRLLEGVNIELVEGNFVVEGEKLASRSRGSFLTTSVFSTPKPGFKKNGDAYFIKRYGDEALLAVIDSLGHGEAAFEVSNVAISVLEDSYYHDLTEIINRLQERLAGTRGCVIGLSRLTSGGKLQYAGIGNVRAVVYVQGDTKSLVSQDGFLGGKFRSVKVKDYSFSTPFLLTVYTDGVSRFRLEGPDLLSRQVVEVASYIYKKYKKGSDDATILVAKAR